MAVYVSIVLLTMLLVLMAIFITSNSTRKSQLMSAMKVKESYEADNDRAADIYSELTGNVQTPSGPSYVSNGLVLHYDAINNTGNGHSSNTTTWKDLSGNGNDAKITGGTWGTNYLQFTQSNTQNGVETNSNFPIDFNNTFNIVFSLSSVSGVEVLFGSRTTTSNGMMLFNYSTNNRLTLDTVGSNSRTILGERLAANTPYNLTVTFSGTTAKLYLEGELVNTVSFTDGSLNFPLTIFTANEQANPIGNIYSVKVYNRALNDSEVKTNYEVDQQRFIESYVTDGLILHYDAINNTGNGHSSNTTTWKDLSGNGNDAKITGGTWGTNYLRFTQSNEQNGVKTNSNFPIDFNNTFNIVFTLSSVSSVEALFGARTSTTDGMMLFNYNDNNRLTLDTKGGGSRVILGDRLSANRKYNLTVTFSGTTAKLYINGQLTNTVTFTDASLNFPLTIFTAGTRTNSLGDIYSVKVYNRALNATEILQNYNVDNERY